MRILALPYGHSVAHTSRLVEIAKILRERNHEVIFAGSLSELSCLKIAGYANFKVVELIDVPIERVIQALRTTNFSLLYGDADEMENYINHELKLYEELKPDLILVDDRRTALASADLAGLPHVSIVNAHVTNYSFFPLLLINTRKFSALPNNILSLLCQFQVKIERSFYNTALKGIHQTRTKLGLKKIFAYQITEGKDLTLMPDIPEFTPVNKAPHSFHYIGPITWKSDLPKSKFHQEFLNSSKRAYFTLGSGGFEEFITHMSVFQNSEFNIFLAAGELIEQTANYNFPANVFVERYVNTDILLPDCDVVVCHGGNGTIYQALMYGVPIISIPSHNEQEYNARRVEQLGLGKRLNHAKVIKDFSLILKAMEEIVSSAFYKENAQKYQLLLKQWNGAVKAADLIENLLRHRAETLP